MKIPAPLPIMQEPALIAFAQMPYASQPHADHVDTLDEFHPVAVIRFGSLAIAVSNSVNDDLLNRILQEVCHA